MAQALQFLIIDGYAKASRDDFDVAGMRHAWKLYEDLLKQHLPNAESKVWFPSDNAEPPAGPANFHAVLWTGCNLTIYADEDRVLRQIEYAQKAFEVGTPSFGSCWGMQMAAVAAGGEVEANPKGREMGLARKIHLTEAGRDHPLMRGKPPVFSAFISHVDQVTKLPPGATVLAGNDFTEVQALAVTHGKGTFWSTQYHCEYDLAEVARLLVARKSKLLREGFFSKDSDFEKYVNKFEALAKEPERKDLRWQLDIDDDVLNDPIRQCEFINWIEHGLKPNIDKNG